ncbi:hypothetical protein COCON_G00013430 [Conger conger]|uniref:rRNA adenine N(6)-methyltransferase n=1 Tax=Conger conger TaxID=82655 RepID=A0A9Q1E3M0_CONCO|nr:dimethyladenosine transferase 2, mitochondrial [Conger conger]XP_061113064.1 dimethyladenosine transferase 2, mitochondrial [Conger conger]XP_061113073.1 dimethyladenosine transferase 2, mitochondrial [Conger conger]KAJ8288684.1 hypothetical protein COCON_G00013430 [Conger conger]
MSASSSRLLVLAVRTACSHTQRRYLLANTPVFAQLREYVTDPLSVSSRKAQVPSYKADRISQDMGLNHRNLSAVATSLKDKSRYDIVDIGEVEENISKARKCTGPRHFIVDPALAQLVADHLQNDLADGKTFIFEYNPGPGVLTRTLLNSGAQRLVALESDRKFLPELEALENSLYGQLEVVHCNFLTLDTFLDEPAIDSEKLFTDLGISEVPWADDVPVKVVGLFYPSTESKRLWNLIYNLFQRHSIYRYGRVEIVMFMTEKLFTRLSSSPGEFMIYRDLTVLWQMACNIELLHKEPMSSFLAVNKTGKVSKCKTLTKNTHMCLVRLTPRQGLFSGCLNPANSTALIMLVRQCLVKRKALLKDKLNAWSPNSGEKILNELGIRSNILTGELSQEDYKNLFQVMLQTNLFSHCWLD